MNTKCTIRRKHTSGLIILVKNFQLIEGCDRMTHFCQIYLIVLDEVFRRLNWECIGLKINGEHLNYIRFAADAMLISNTTKEPEEMGKNEQKRALKSNLEKTQWITNGKDKIIHLSREAVTCSEEVTYLGQIISFKNRRGK